jgi:hypothetical protein
MKLRSFGVLMLTATAIVFSPLAATNQAAEPKHSIKDVMQNGHRMGLLRKVLDGQASAEEKSTLLDYYVSLTESAPPRGSAEEWTAKTNAVVVAAAKVVTGREGATDALRAATNCMACHSVHRPPQN